MINKIRHSIRFAKSLIREKLKSVKRSPKWDNVRDQFLAANPFCEACGHRSGLQVHHVKPFKTNPELELDSNNLITLCMGPEECHNNHVLNFPINFDVLPFPDLHDPLSFALFL